MTNPRITVYTVIDSPLGPLGLARTGLGLSRIRFLKEKNPQPPPSWTRDDGAFSDATVQLRDFFSGKLRAFSLPLAPRGTAFQMRVWNQLKAIPYGQTISYGQLAQLVGKPSASRAVGAANGRNPLPIVIPCHRVIGSDGSLTGYGGGVEIKKTLLELEVGVLNGGQPRPSARISHRLHWS
ncbi:MAG: methylated-DNA--[protein]-cysteine S-methyltransferase [Acidobacteriota bacterium]